VFLFSSFVVITSSLYNQVLDWILDQSFITINKLYSSYSKESLKVLVQTDLSDYSTVSNSVATISDEFKRYETQKLLFLRAARLEKLSNSLTYATTNEEKDILLRSNRKKIKEFIIVDKNSQVLKNYLSQYDDATLSYYEEKLSKLNKRNLHIISSYIGDCKSNAKRLNNYLLEHCINSNDDKEIILMKRYLFDSIPTSYQPFIRACLFNNNENLSFYSDFFTYHKVWTYQMICVISVIALIIHFVALLYYLFQFDSIIVSVNSALLWSIILAVSLIQYHFLIEPTIIIARDVIVTQYFIGTLVFQYINKIAVRTKLILMRSSGLMRDAHALVQHLNPACRVARLHPSLPVSRLLLSMSDADVGSFDISQPWTIKIIIAKMCFFPFSYVPYKIGEMIILIMILIAWNGIILGFYFLGKSSYIISLAIACGIIVMSMIIIIFSLVRYFKKSHIAVYDYDMKLNQNVPFLLRNSKRVRQQQQQQLSSSIDKMDDYDNESIDTHNIDIAIQKPHQKQRSSSSLYIDNNAIKQELIARNNDNYYDNGEEKSSVNDDVKVKPTKKTKKSHKHKRRNGLNLNKIEPTDSMELNENSSVTSLKPYGIRLKPLHIDSLHTLNSSVSHDSDALNISSNTLNQNMIAANDFLLVQNKRGRLLATSTMTTAYNPRGENVDTQHDSLERDMNKNVSWYDEEDDNGTSDNFESNIIQRDSSYENNNIMRTFHDMKPFDRKMPFVQSSQFYNTTIDSTASISPSQQDHDYRYSRRKLNSIRRRASALMLGSSNQVQIDSPDRRTSNFIGPGQRNFNYLETSPSEFTDYEEAGVNYKGFSSQNNSSFTGIAGNGVMNYVESLGRRDDTSIVYTGIDGQRLMTGEEGMDQNNSQVFVGLGQQRDLNEEGRVRAIPARTRPSSSTSSRRDLQYIGPGQREFAAFTRDPRGSMEDVVVERGGRRPSSGRNIGTFGNSELNFRGGPFTQQRGVGSYSGTLGQREFVNGGSNSSMGSSHFDTSYGGGGGGGGEGPGHRNYAVNRQSSNNHPLEFMLSNMIIGEDDGSVAINKSAYSENMSEDRNEPILNTPMNQRDLHNQSSNRGKRHRNRVRNKQ
jgi:hypothetical protein